MDQDILEADRSYMFALKTFRRLLDQKEKLTIADQDTKMKLVDGLCVFLKVVLFFSQAMNSFHKLSYWATS